jgi:hypothetical protein
MPMQLQFPAQPWNCGTIKGIPYTFRQMFAYRFHNALHLRQRLELQEDGQPGREHDERAAEGGLEEGDEYLYHGRRVGLLRLRPRSRFPSLREPAPCWGTVLDTTFRCAEETRRRGLGRDA